jgi:myosin heavy subunit
MKSESENLLPSSLSGEPILKKRKYSTKNEDENDELTELKAEMEKMKQLIEGQQKTIYNQAMTITRLESEKASKNVTDESIIEDPNTSENKVELKNGELKQIIEEERRKMDTELVELKSNMGAQIINLQKQNEEKDQKIKELEESVASIKNVISDPGFAEGDKKRSACDDAEKKIKDLEAQLELKISTETALKKTIADLEEDRKQLTKLLYQTNTDKLKLEILEQKKKIKGLEKMIELKEEDLKDFESRITEMDAIYKDVNQQNMDLKEKEYKQLTVEYEKKMKDMKTESEKCKVENDGLKNTVNELTKLLSNEQKSVIKHETKIKEMEAEIDKLKVTVDDLNKELFEKRKNAVVQFIENEQLKQKITIFEENEAKLH